MFSSNVEHKALWEVIRKLMHQVRELEREREETLLGKTIHKSLPVPTDREVAERIMDLTPPPEIGKL